MTATTTFQKHELQGDVFRFFQELPAKLKKREAYVMGVQLTGLLGVGALGSWALYGWSAKNVIALAAALASAKFYGGAKGVKKVFADYFPQSLALTRSACKPSPSASETGVWLGTGRDVRWSQFYDPDLAVDMAAFFKERGIRSVYDFGCGQDHYTACFKKEGIDALGLDGNAALSGTAKEQDLAHEFQMPPRDCVISLEVGAKIRKRFEKQYIDNIVNHAGKMAIVSWPIPGQPGPNQFNPQTNAYVIEKFRAKGFDYDKDASDRLREAASEVHFWYKDTLMVFRRREGVRS